MEAYLDNSATTRCSGRAVACMLKALTEEYGNPSSLHGRGKEAEDIVREARAKVAGTLKADEKEIVFTSGGTESNNLAICGTALANRRAGRHIITTGIEHASVLAPVDFLKEQGFDITYLGVDKEGRISLKELKEAIREDTILVSIMMVNNEIGTVEPIAEAAKVIHAANPKTLFHVDAIQAYGKYRILPRRLGTDLLSVSGHKIHAPKGTGFLYIREKTKIRPILFGGGQQRGMRSGTENVPGVAALGEAASESYEDFDTKTAHLRALRERFIDGTAQMEGVTINGPKGQEAAPHIVSVTVDGVRSEVILHALEEKQIYVSAGSACASNKSAQPSASRTLEGIGLSRQAQESTIRVSFCADTTVEEVDYAVEEMRKVIPFLRRYTRK